MDESYAMPRHNEHLGPLRITVTPERVLAYAEASGDRNPIHIDADFAASTVFGAPIAHGMLLLAYLSRMLSARFGRAWLETGRLEARFRAPAMVGMLVTVRGTIRSVQESTDGAQVECELSCDDASGQVLVTATARLMAPTRERPASGA